jgi:hypothetical protein
MKLPISRILAVGYIDEFRKKQSLASTVAEPDPLKVSTMEDNKSAVL